MSLDRIGLRLDTAPAGQVWLVAGCAHVGEWQYGDRVRHGHGVHRHGDRHDPDDAGVRKEQSPEVALHFSRLGAYDRDHPVPIIERGEG